MIQNSANLKRRRFTVGRNYKTRRDTKQPYDDVADAIEDLRERKQQALTKKAEEEGQKLRIEEMKRFLRGLGQELTDYDEQMVRKYIERITVYDNHYEVEFKAGIRGEIEK